MKTIPLILSLAMGVTAALEEDSAAAAAANGGIRATKVVTDRTKRDAAAAGGTTAASDTPRRRSTGDNPEGKAKRRSSRKMKDRSGGRKGRSSERKDRSKQRLTQRIQRDPEEHKKLNDRRRLIKERVDRSKRQQAEGDGGDDGKKDAKNSLGEL